MEAAAVQLSRPTVTTQIGRRWPRFELSCSTCGYGIVVRIAPERCPMCSGSTWEHPRRRSGSALAAANTVLA
jgi:rubrerythrin